MSNDIKWLEVVKDYGKRFPKVTCKDLLGSVCNCKDRIIDMNCVNVNDPEEFYYMQDKKGDNNIFCTVKIGGLGALEYRDYEHNDWRLVPQHILLRLLTEGKEDLI